MKIVDNFLDQSDFKDIKQIITDPTFPWSLNHGVSFEHDGHVQFTIQFTKTTNSKVHGNWVDLIY